MFLGFLRLKWLLLTGEVITTLYLFNPVPVHRLEMVASAKGSVGCSAFQHPKYFGCSTILFLLFFSCLKSQRK
ncbi:MAG: hypothetical protein B6D45_02190 [Ignavibacteriales bacterium UTCHB3]|nr:MAG: hypothetical protein B6D45_02190 [Ignavibacteriales bacterium UTCHB3]